MKQFKIKFNKQDYKICFIESMSEAARIAEKLRDSEAKNFGIDIETYKATAAKKAGLDPYHSGISTVQLYDGTDTVHVFDVTTCGLDWLIFLKNKNFVAHYAIFELKHLKNKGIGYLNIGCSMLLSMLVDRAETSPFKPYDEEDIDDEEDEKTYKGYGLDAIIGRLFDIRIDKKWQTYDWHTRPLPSEAIAYSALDAVLTYKIAEVQIKRINEYKMQKHYKLLRDMQYVIVDMELNGMKMDEKLHKKLIKEWEKAEKAQKLECAKHFADINLNSTKQLGEWAKGKYKKEVLDAWITTKTGALGFGKSALAEMQHLPEIKSLLEYKKTSKMLSTYGVSLMEQVNSITQRIHCSFSLGETRTGRLSSREPNLQNLPRDSKMRDLFVAEKGYKLIVADFNQIELRVAGELSRDPVILKAYQNGDDLHAVFAARMYGVPLSKVTKEQRQIAKSANFGAIYGMGPNKFITYTLSSTGGAVKISFEEADHTIKSLWQLYKGYDRWCYNTRQSAEILGFVRTKMGKMRRLHPKEVYTKAPNTIVQGTAFEVMAIAMTCLRQELKNHDAFKIINSVHDEIIIEAKEGYEEIGKKLVEESMVWGMETVFSNPVLHGLANAKICDTWGEGK